MTFFGHDTSSATVRESSFKFVSHRPHVKVRQVEDQAVMQFE
jgi:hypothetical protein